MHGEVLAHQEESGLSEELHEDRSEKVVEDWPGSRKSVERTGGGCCACRRLKLRRQMAAARKKESVPLTLFLEVNDLEVEDELRKQKGLGLANGLQNRRRRGGSRFLRFRRGAR